MRSAIQPITGRILAFESHISLPLSLKSVYSLDFVSCRAAADAQEKRMAARRIGRPLISVPSDVARVLS